MRVKEAAERLEVNASTIYALVAAGKLACNRIGLGRGAIRISDEQLTEFVARSATGPRPAPPAPKVRQKAYVPRKHHGL